jgi:hypothetical protein
MEDISMKTAINKTTSNLKVIKPILIEKLFGSRSSLYINKGGSPTDKLIRLLCDGDDYMKDVIRGAVTFIA